MKKAITTEKILNFIPHKTPFRFIEEILEVDINSAKGTYFFKKNEYFYEGHFPNKPITPGVILTEAMLQIGLIPLGIMNYANEFPDDKVEAIIPIFTDAQLKFLHPVYPETTVTVVSEKVYFRLNRLKSKVKLYNEQGKICSSGILNGTFIIEGRDLI
jgi:3-hydroxyacyl-[acyl-carrier-protein] dehydratase